MEEWLKIGLTALGTCVTAWGGVALKHWFDGRRPIGPAVDVSTLSQRLAALESEVALLKTRDGPSSLAGKLDDAHLVALNGALSSLEELASDLTETYHKSWHRSHVGDQDARQWIANIRRDAAAVSKSYTEHPEYDYQVLSNLRNLGAQFTELEVKMENQRVVVRATSHDKLTEALHTAMLVVDRARREIVQRLRSNTKG